MTCSSVCRRLPVVGAARPSPICAGAAPLSPVDVAAPEAGGGAGTGTPWVSLVPGVSCCVEVFVLAPPSARSSVERRTGMEF